MKRCYSCGSYYTPYNDETIKKYIQSVRYIKDRKNMTAPEFYKDLGMSPTTWNRILWTENFKGEYPKLNQGTIRAMEEFIEKYKDVV